MFQNYLATRQDSSRLTWPRIEENVYSLTPELEVIREILLERGNQAYQGLRFDPFTQQLDATSADSLLKELRGAMETRNSELMDYCLQRLRQLCVHNKLTRSAESLLLSIRLAQDLRGVMACRDPCKIQVVVNRIVSVGLKSKLSGICSEAELLLKRLRKLETLKVKFLGLDSSCYSEIRSYYDPPTIVFSVLKALLLLLGTSERELQSWGQCKAQIGRVGRDSVKRKVAGYQISCLEKSTARKAKLLTQRLSYESVMEVSTGCVVIFGWIQAIIAEVLDKE